MSEPSRAAALQEELWGLAVKKGVDVGLQSITLREEGGAVIATVSTMYVAMAHGGTSFEVSADILREALSAIPKMDCEHAFDRFINSPGIREHIAEECLD